MYYLWVNKLKNKTMENDNYTGIVQIEKPGGPEVLKYDRVEIPHPGANEILIAQKAVGVNFLDVFFRNGTFPVDTYPAPIGFEAAGVIEKIGSAVKGLNVGDHVAYYASVGAYAEKRIIDSNEIFKLPNALTFDVAASVMIKGLTAHMLIKQSHQLKSGEVVLVHAMTGGVGTILSQWAKALGATVIGTVGSSAKKDLALKRGFTQVIDLGSENLETAVRNYTGGNGVDVFYDGTGKTTFEPSLVVLKDGGSAVLYGWASGMPTIDKELMDKRNIKFSFDALNDYPLYRDKSGKGMPEIFDLLMDGKITLEAPKIYPLMQASMAHADMESRNTTGSVLLKP